MTISEGDRVYSTTGSAIDITSGGNSKYDITNNGILQSDNAAAIKIIGAKAGDIVNYGKVIGGMVNGEQIALDTRGSENGIAYVMEGGSETYGNLYLNSDKFGSEVAVKGDAAAIFDGVLVSGAREFKIGQESTLTLRQQSESIVMDLQTDGIFRLSKNSTLNMELNGELADDEAVLKINGAFALDAGVSADLLVKGDLKDAAGTQRLVEADAVTGYDDLKITGGWLLTVDSHQLLTNTDGDQYIEAEISYNTDTSAEDLAKMASDGGADDTESFVLETFGHVALDDTEITTDTITFGSRNSEELANLLNDASNDQQAARLAGELTPDRSGAVIHVIQRSQSHQLDQIDTRLSMNRSGQQGGFWMNIYGYHGEKDIDGRIDGYEVSGLNASFGMDNNYSENIIVGAAFSINRQDIDTQIYDTNYTVDDIPNVSLWRT
ncbi:autotransporter domain-containing protein [Endozoicomonas elysicola]|uniref:autotransporter domain-containing protein n=1 Tax=Endozoicomonas elysicola TaxID=305900 RepID=UPI001267FC7B|nr:autotransporter domain-containing protein [Endozoicomonas elysicola]